MTGQSSPSASDSLKGWGVVALLHAAQEVHFETFGVDGGFGLQVLAHNGRVHLLQQLQHGLVQALDVGEEAHALAGVPQQVDILGGQRADDDAHARRHFVGVERVRADHREVLGEAAVFQLVEQVDHQAGTPPLSQPC
jgi:hypothetical protein